MSGADQATNGCAREERERNDLYCINPEIQEAAMEEGEMAYRQEKISEPTHRGELKIPET